MTTKWPDLCPTCKRPYVQNEQSFCSNGFHGCRDCTWKDGRRTKLCDYHKDYP